METLIHYLHALLLGMVEGLTEFIPVSSTGHLILLVDILGFASPPGHVFEVFIQLGAISAICWLYRKKLIHTATTLHKNSVSQRFTLNLLLAFMPAMLIGGLFHSTIKTLLFSPKVVAIALLVGGIIILLVERLPLKPKTLETDAITPSLAFKIGLCQCLAMVPGTSRSGATIIGALLLGVERKVAAEFSFYLAIPTMFAAVVYDLYKNVDAISLHDTSLLLTGFLAAFLSAILVVKTLIRFVSTHGFTAFGYYRILVGGVMLFFLF